MICNRFPFISIVVPVYNVEPYIEACLRSVATQTYQGEVECVLVDDCGKDRSMDLVDKFVQSYQGPILFRIHHRSANGGLSAARNDGMQLAKGEYIYFLDSDDELTPNCLESLTALLQTHSIDMVIGDYHAVGTNKVFPSPSLPGQCILRDPFIFHSYQCSAWYVMAWNKLYRKDFLVQNGLTFLEGIIHEDVLWSFQVAILAKNMCYVKQLCYIYKVREGSIMTSTDKNRSAQDMAMILQEMFSFIKSHQLRMNNDLHHVLQRQLLATLILLDSADRTDLFDKTYRDFRACFPENSLLAFLRNRFYYKSCLRDLHLLFPVPLGLLFEKWIVKAKRKHVANSTSST